MTKNYSPFDRHHHLTIQLKLTYIKGENEISQNKSDRHTMNERIGTGTDLDPFQLIEREGITTFIN